MPTKRYAPLLAALVRAATGPLTTVAPAGVRRDVRRLFAKLFDAAVNGVIAFGPTLAEREAWADAELAELQKEVVAILNGVVESPSEPGAEPSGALLRDVTLTLTFAPAPDGDRQVHLTVDGSAREVFLYLFLRLLSHVGTTHILKCPECGQLFVKIGRSDYCSPLHQKRFAMRRLRRSKADRKRKREAQRHGRATGKS